MPAKKPKPVSLVIPPDHAGQRLDQALAAMLPEFSRTRLKGWIENGKVLVAGQQSRPREIVLGGEAVVLTPVIEADERVHAEDIALDIVHEDKHLLVINKPAGLVVHPGAGNRTGTLQNALLNFDKKLSLLPRGGLVHRIDKDTSGLLVVARTLAAHTALTEMIEAHDIQRQYEAVCVGVMTAGGTVDAPIGRHPVDRVKMSIRSNGREAVTHYRVIKRYRAHTHVRLQLETGRTHQIRVHLAHVGYPLVGDAVYGRRLLIPKGASNKVATTLREFHRQALHAAQLEFIHPVTKKPMTCKASMPPDMKQLLKALETDFKEHST
ncbi:MAG TPA: 23S rRNA pseudouridine(1911/1915/1917) synthase RluD [Steroidobacteraceae bacterium]|nr:23S rRNA pseudouridine(1911/1915/1917) synthase RluD [Steroidobacteraceae bacterium]